MYHTLNFQACYHVINDTTEYFKQPDILISRDIQDVLLNSWNQKSLDGSLSALVKMYISNLKWDLLRIQLKKPTAAVDIDDISVSKPLIFWIFFF